MPKFGVLNIFWTIVKGITTEVVRKSLRFFVEFKIVKKCLFQGRKSQENRLKEFLISLNVILY